MKKKNKTKYIFKKERKTEKERQAAAGRERRDSSSLSAAAAASSSLHPQHGREKKSETMRHMTAGWMVGDGGDNELGF